MGQDQMESNDEKGGRGQLYLGDCLEIMRSLPDQVIDAVVTDPP
jgi:DNA modification methylase